MARKPSKKLKELGDKLNIRQRLFCQYYILGFDEEREVQAGPKRSRKNPFDRDDEDEDEEPKTFTQRVRVRMGNATRSYAKAYGMDPAKHEMSCAVNASKLLKNAKAQAYMDQILEDNGFNARAVDARLNEIIFDGEDKHSVQAIKHYNELKRRIDPVQAPVTVHVDLDGRAAELVKKYKNARFPDTDKESK